MLTRRPVGPVALALMKAGGAAHTDQLAATAGLSRQEVLDQLYQLSRRGEVVEAGGMWQAVQAAPLVDLVS